MFCWENEALTEIGLLKFALLICALSIASFKKFAFEPCWDLNTVPRNEPQKLFE